MRSIHVKRVYDAPKQSDGMRILVDRVWPRGMTKAKLKADLWLKDVAPSTALRKWFAHDAKKWPQFKRRYFAELKATPEPLATLRAAAAKQPITLLYSARDELHNQAAALRDYLKQRPMRSRNARFAAKNQDDPFLFPKAGGPHEGSRGFSQHTLQIYPEGNHPDVPRTDIPGIAERIH
jgi:uncharacterized protein YeaO (DUF488 family)